ncbi:hypothetical protein Avbf_13257 [Armadillidium vulgare]|nr:hypothetical protein Avbf_13257 [Armadillidium vulgare]
MLKYGIGMDASVTPLRHGGLSLVQTTDFFYPLVDDPYMMGKITCANVLSDLYAMGVTDCDNMLMLLGVSTKMTEKERDVVIPLMMRGCSLLARTNITDTNCNESLVPHNAVSWRFLVLTKPLPDQSSCKCPSILDQPETQTR